MTVDAFTTMDAVRLSGLTYRQLDYWDRRNVIRPSIEDADGSGSRRYWSARDLAVLCAIGKVWRDLQAVGLAGRGVGPHADLIGELWTALHARAQVVIRHGSVTISVARPVIDGHQMTLSFAEA